MAVYNERPHLEEAVQSILAQTFGDFEFIIVNDGSTDGTGNVLERLAGRDDRIRLVHQENRGVCRSRNRALSMANGRFMAIMDGDDVSDSRRLERQVQFLRTRPEIGLVGTKIKYIDADGQVTGRGHRPTEPDVMAWKLLFNTCICHPSVMARRTLFEELGGYCEWAPVGQDYELFTRAVQVSELATVPDRLFKLRRHSGSVTVSKRKEQVRIAGKAAANLHRALLGSRADEQRSAFLVWMETEGIERALEETSIQDLDTIHGYVRALYRAYVRRLRSDGINVRVRGAALAKLDIIAEQIAGCKGRARGLLQKVRARCMPPANEILPWVVQAMRRRVA